MAKKAPTTVVNGVKLKPGVFLSNEEFDALMALKESNADSVVTDAKMANRNHDLLVTCNAQARRLIECDLVIQNYERIMSMQRIFIDTLRVDYPRVGSVEDLSEFWRQWNLQIGERASPELTPDLFKSWSLWARDSGRQNRAFAMAGSMAGTRTEVEAMQPSSQTELQEAAVARLRDLNAKLAARVCELEGEVDTYKNASRAKGGGRG